jgi:DNA primase
VNDDFQQAVAEIKQRLPVEEVVRWYVPDLKRQGALWVACCPFHSEKTPSFKVDPRRGTWYCYGACSTGGDQIDFVERANRVEFLEALEILASRAGVSLPDRRSQEGRKREDENQPLYDVLARAERYFARKLRTAEGRAALEYVRSRGLRDETVEAFGVGYAPAGGPQGLVSRALSQGVPLATLVAAGLAREGGARASDFFFKRLTFPVRDLKGRTVGFGARRLDEAAGGPKYVNTPEKALFHKGRLIYGLDRALDSVRRSGHLVLVEGYTDVMAAHQAGLTNVAAVLGTSTTEEHAALVRRSGARRVSLVFDGDEAGRRATHKALSGLLPLDVELDVVRLAGGEDPCEVLVRPGGAEAFATELERASGWFEHLVGELGALPDAERWAATDRLLELIACLARPLAREARVEELAARLGVPVESVRAQLESLPERRREALRRLERRPDDDEAARPEQDGGPDAPTARLRRDWGLLVGALLVEPELVDEARRWAGRCPFADLAAVLDAALAAQGEPSERLSAVLAALGGDRARSLVVRLMEETGKYENARELFEDARRSLVEQATRRELERELDGLKSGDGAERERLARLYQQLRAMKIEGCDAAGDAADPGGPRGSVAQEQDVVSDARGPTRREDPAGVS